MRFRDRHVLVTGAAQGLGREIALAFAQEGASLALLDKAESTETLEALTSLGATACGVQADITDERAVRRAVDEAADRMDGGLDVLVNNAGFNGFYSLIGDFPTEHFRRTYEINLVGTLNVTKAVLPLLKRDAGSAVVNVASNVAKRGLPYRADYVCSKWALLGFTQTLALELAPIGIRVNAVCPGPVEGNRIDEIVESQARIEGRPPAEVRRAWAEAAPMRRFIEPGEAAAVILFLASEGSSAMTGQALNVTGGFLMN